MRSGVDCKGNRWEERPVGRMKDLTGMRFTRLLVLFPVFVCGRSKKRYYWLCQCECGKEIACRSDCLQNQHIQSCGCMTVDGVYRKSQTIAENMIGQRFGKLIVTEFIGCKIGSNGVGKSMFRCTCDCGNTEFIVAGNSLTCGLTLSCGCLTRSVGEENIERILRLNAIHFKPEYIFEDLKSYYDRPLRYDFAILDDNNIPIRLIEFDGEQHSKPIDRFGGEESFKILQINDSIKNTYALSHNIPLVRIPYTLRNNVVLQDLFNDQYLVSG